MDSRLTQLEHLLAQFVDACSVTGHCSALIAQARVLLATDNATHVSITINGKLYQVPKGTQATFEELVNTAGEGLENPLVTCVGGDFLGSWSWPLQGSFRLQEGMAISVSENQVVYNRGQMIVASLYT